METRNNKSKNKRNAFLLIIFLVGLTYISYHNAERIILSHKLNNLKASITHKEQEVVKNFTSDIDVNSFDLEELKNKIDSLKVDSLKVDSLLRTDYSQKAFTQNLDISYFLFILAWENYIRYSPNNTSSDEDYYINSIKNMQLLNLCITKIAYAMVIKIGGDAIISMDSTHNKKFDEQSSIFIRNFSKYNVLLNTKISPRLDDVIKKLLVLHQNFKSGRRYSRSDLKKVMQPFEDLKKDKDFYIFVDAFLSNYIEFEKLDQIYDQNKSITYSNEEIEEFIDKMLEYS